MKEPGKAQLAIVFVALVVVWILSEPQQLMAQRSSRQPFPPPKSNEYPDQPSTSPISTDGRPAGTGNGSLGSSRRETPADSVTMMLRRRAAAELAEDFERLRRINRERIGSLSSSSPLNYKGLSQLTGEINRRAKRIKSNIHLALKEKKNEKRTYEADATRLGSLLPELSRLIDSFLGSPVFHTASARDEELRSTAGRDLESIIRLSETINKVAKRLIKTSTGQPA